MADAHFDTDWRCPNCGGPLRTENYAEATITLGDCGYSWSAAFGGGEIQETPCRRARAALSRSAGSGPAGG